MINLTKKYRTRDGHSVEILGINTKSEWKFPVWGKIENQGVNQIRLWTSLGHYIDEPRSDFRGHPWDLFLEGK
jgi:hypothetical protein